MSSAFISTIEYVVQALSESGFRAWQVVKTKAPMKAPILPETPEYVDLSDNVKLIVLNYVRTRSPLYHHR